MKRICIFLPVLVLTFLTASSQYYINDWNVLSGLLVERETTIVNEGDYAARVSVNSTSHLTTQLLTASIPVSEGDNIRTTLQYNTSQYVYLQVVYHWNTGPDWYSTDFGKSTDDATYQEGLAVATVPAGVSSVEVTLMFHDEPGFSEGEIQYIDDIVIESPIPTVLDIPNTDFESWYQETYTQFNEIVGSLVDEDDFGADVDICGDFAIVGAEWSFPDSLGNNRMGGAGLAYIFEKNRGGEGNWGEMKIIQAGVRSNNDFFGNAVSISGDIALVAAKQEDEDADELTTLTDAGSAYVFYRDQGGTSNWGQIAKLVASDRDEFDRFGHSADLDGDYAVIGAIYEDEDAEGSNYLGSSGSAYVFEKDLTGTDKWGQRAKLVAGDRKKGANFGNTVAISGDKIIVTAVSDSSDADDLNYLFDAGAAYIFYKDQGVTDGWGQVCKIVAGDRREGDWFGTGCDIEGETAIVGAMFQDLNKNQLDSLPGAGAAYIYYKNQGGDNEWGQVAKLLAEDRGSGYNFGWDVCLSGDYAFVGSIQAQDGFSGTYPGAIYVFHRNEGGEDNWGQVAKLFHKGRNDGDQLGNALAADEDYLIAGNYSLDKAFIFKEIKQAQNIKATDPETNALNLSWQNGDGTGRMVLISDDPNSLPPEPEDSMLYTANPAMGQGSMLSGYYYCVYNGTGNNVRVTDLALNAEYKVVIYEYNDDYYYYTGLVPGNPKVFKTAIDLSGPETRVADGILYNTEVSQQYSLNSTDGTDGDWLDCSSPETSVDFVPGKVWVREKAMPENFRFIREIPPVAPAPAFTIDYQNETTNEIIDKTHQYGNTGEVESDTNTGPGTVLSLMPGTYMFFSLKPTDTTFQSEIQELQVKARPAAPSFTIDFPAETTVEEGDTIQEFYSTNGSGDPSETLTCPFTPVPLIPDTEIEYNFRVRSFDTSFVSEWFTLNIPPRPGITGYTIDFVSEVTNENIAVTDEYSVNSDFSDAAGGAGVRLPVTPGTDLYLRIKSTASTFSGVIQHMVVPSKEVAPVVSLSDRNSPAAKFKKSTDGTGADVEIADGFEYSTDGGANWTQITNLVTIDASGMKHIIVRKKATLSTFASVPTDNLDHAKPVVNAAGQSSCNDEMGIVAVSSSTDNGKVYIILDGEPAATAADLAAAESAGKAASADVSAANTDFDIAIENLPAGTYYAYSINAADSLSDKGSNAITIHAIPDVDLGDAIIKCESTEVTLDPGSGYSSYSWSAAGATTQAVDISAAGWYTVTVSDVNSCENKDSVEVKLNVPYPDEKICIVTIDPISGKNMVVWEKSQDVGTIGYHVYREKTIGQYELIGQVMNPDLSIFKDTMVNPKNQSYLYKITSVDSCGNESELEDNAYHKPIFLKYAGSDNGINLEWTNYAVEGVTDLGDYLTSFEIWRGTDSTTLTFYKEVGSINNYTDTDPNAMLLRYYYRVYGVLKDPCYPSEGKKAGTGPYQHALSNMDDNKLKEEQDTTSTDTTSTDTTSTFVWNPMAGEGLLIYPNPFSDQTTVRFINPEDEKYRMILLDISGKIVRMKEGIREEEFHINRQGLKSGYYQVTLIGPRIYRGTLIMK